jgi:biotin operon repressor
MILKIVVVVFSFLFFYGCSGGGASDTQNNTINIKYTEDSNANLLNPDRGFYDADYELNVKKNYNIFDGVRESGYTLVYAPLNLEEYNTTAQLPDTLIDTIEKNLKDANSSGVGLIFRIKYRSSINGYDPSKDIIMGHLNQLKPLLQRYKNVISVVQAGVIGAWGEWHSFTGDYADSNESYKENRKEIIEKLIEIFPDKYIQIRTPMHKEQLFGISGEYTQEGTEGMITEDIAYSNDIRAKIGHHNDCVLANASDMGTYPSDNIEFWKSYVVNDSKYAPVGGETCGIGEDEDALLSDCANAIAEFKRLQYSFLNDAYHPDVLQKWKDQGCYDEIRKNLGYRLVAHKLTMIQDKNTLALTLSIENKGYAAPYIKSDVNFILKNSTREYTFHQDIDMRTFYPNGTKNIEDTISLDDIDAGTYCLYIQIGKEYTAIRLSNKDIWEESSRANKLACDIVIK